MAQLDQEDTSDSQSELTRLRQRVAHLEDSNVALQARIEHLQQEVQSERIRYDEALHESETLLHLVIHQLPAIVWTIDLNYRFTSVQGAGLKTLGLEVEHIIGTTVFDLFRGQNETFPPIQAHLRALRGEPASYEYQTRGYTYHVYVEPLRSADEQIVGAVAVATDITERKRAEETLQESAERFRLVTLATRDALYDWDMQHNTVWRNDAFQQLFGEADTIDPHVSWWENRIHGSDRDVVLNSLHTAIAEGQHTWESEYRFCRTDGTYAVVEDHSYIVRDETGIPTRVIGGMSDITKRKQAEAIQATQLAVTRILATSSSLDVAMPKILQVTCWLLDWQIGVLWQADEANEAQHCAVLWCEPELVETDFVQTIPGLSFPAESGLIGRVWSTGRAAWLDDISHDAHFAQLVHIAEAASATLFAAPVGSGPNCDRVLCFISYGGRPHDAILADMLIDIGQQIKQFIDRKEVEAALEAERASLAERVAQRTAELSSVNAELARAVRVKNEFLATMSHELRTPLNIILGFAEVLRETTYGPLNDQQQSALHSIYESGHHLLNLINDILDLSRIEAGNVYLQLDTVGIEKICQSSLRFVRHDARDKNIDVKFHLNETLSTIQADERRLKQILVNLLSNAVKFTPPGGTIGLDVTPDETRNVVSFSVWDTGIGIDHEHMNRLFRPFEQLDGGLNKQYEGMGLGLALVARLAEMHSGSVSVESEVGQGSRFTVLLPWQHTLDTKTANDQEWNAPLNIQRALLIANTSPDEEPVVQHLEALGIEVHIHRGGTNALEQIRVIQPDIILLDPVLPDLSGWQVLMHIKAETAEQDIPVIMLSLLDEHMRALALGAADCLVRPISRQDMQQTLTKVSWYLKHTLDAAAPALPDESSKPPLILLTDDNDATIHLLSEYLISQGYRVDVARNGSEAVQYIREQRPDLVLMDWQMPVMNGLEATHHIRRDARLDDLPIIALTALAMPGDRESCLAAGVNEYLSKPVSLQELMHVIRRYLGQRGQG